MYFCDEKAQSLAAIHIFALTFFSFLKQVREPSTVPKQAVDGVSMVWSSAPCTATEGELMIDLGLLDREGGFRSDSARDYIKDCWYWFLVSSLLPSQIVIGSLKNNFLWVWLNLKILDPLSSNFNQI